MKKRMDSAAELLRHTDLTISAVMEKCGMRDQSHFGATFRKYYGETPRVYRKKFRPTRNI